MKTLQTILENCSNSMTNYIEAISDSLISILNTKNYLIRIKIGRCLLTLIKLKNDILSKNSTSVCKIFNFFNENLSFENYDLNFLASEFYLYLIEDLNEEDSPMALEYLNENIKFITNYFFLFSKLTNNDICGEEIENKDCDMSESGSTFTGNTCINSEPDEFADEMEEEDLIEFSEGKINNYNKSWSLRKCCSKLLDKLSSLFPNEVLSIIQPYLENEIEDKNWLIKERSILTLGAISTGCYEGLKPNLVGLVNFLLVELSHENKLIRAITCWTLSRYSSYIASEESASLLPIYLIELLKRFLDSESIVQEAACAAFNIVITYHKDELSPYLKDVLKIITSTYNNFKGSGLIALYDCIILLTENFPDSFLDLDCVSDLIQGLFKRWCNFINMVKNDKDGTNVINDVSKVNFFDVIIALIRVSHEILYNKFDDFFNGCLLIINKLNDDKDIICRSLELISVIIMYMPNQFTKNFNKGQLIVIIFNLIKYDKDLGLKQYVIALIGDICKVDTTLLKNHVDRIIQILIQNLTLVYNKGSVKYDVNQISVCNNSCWTLGLISCNFKEKTNLYITSIMTKIIAIFGLPKLNKSLAQNAAILIGRLALVNSLEISKYIDSISKQFCLSIKFVPDGIEKQEAFKGLCQAVIQNPNGILKYFAFFCDCLCNYKSNDNELELLIQNIISSYISLLGEKFSEYFNSFPEKLKQKMKLRFLFLN